MSYRESFEIASSLPSTIKGVVSAPRSDRALPTVVVCHGFKGFMDWGFFPYLATLLEERGFCVVRFNFSGSGVLPGEDHVADLDAFRRDTFSRELTEIGAILDAVVSGLAAAPIDPDRIALFGHSRGGGGSVLAAAEERWQSRLKALVTWAAVATFDRFDDQTKAAWRQQQGLEIANARTGQLLTMGIEMLHDLEHNSGRLDIARAASQRTAPWLIVHGEDDETVPVSEGQSLYEQATGTKKLERIVGGSHTFGAQHPWIGPTPALTTALNATQRWLRKYL